MFCVLFSFVHSHGNYNDKSLGWEQRAGYPQIQEIKVILSCTRGTSSVITVSRVKITDEQGELGRKSRSGYSGMLQGDLLFFSLLLRTGKP